VWTLKKSFLFRNEIIPIEILGHTLVLNENKEDYPNQINAELFEAFPKIKYIQHNSHFVEKISDGDNNE